MHKQRLAVLITAGVGVLSTFFPWMKGTMAFFGTTSSVSYSGISTLMGILVFLACVGAIVLALIGDREKPVDADKVKFVAIAGGVAFVLSLLFFVTNIGNTGGLAGVGGISLGVGIYLSMIAGLAITAVPFVVKDSGEIAIPTKESIQDEITNMKEDK